MNSRALSLLYQKAHDRIRAAEGLLPQEAFDELLKFLFCKDCGAGRPGASPGALRATFATEIASRFPGDLSPWPARGFHLSDATLVNLQSLFAEVCLSELPPQSARLPGWQDRR